MSFKIPDLKTAEEWLDESAKALSADGIVFLKISEERFLVIEYFIYCNIRVLELEPNNLSALHNLQTIFALISGIHYGIWSSYELARYGKTEEIEKINLNIAPIEPIHFELLKDDQIRIDVEFWKNFAKVEYYELEARKQNNLDLLDECVLLLKMELKKYPHCAAIRMELAHYYMQLQQMDEVIMMLQKATTRDPKSGRAWLMLVDLFFTDFSLKMFGSVGPR